MQTDWEVEERMPKYDDMSEFEVWMRNGEVRRVSRAGNALYTPGTLVFLDCTHPLSNVLCDESNVIGWRYTGRDAPKLPRLKWLPHNWQSLIGNYRYDAAAHSAAYPGY